ncbi:FIG00677039: hypothetical protein [hydrothermal vent metagenome]|uniref:AraC family transcriptional regulator n=1 Tax=hydrothermal vent metagenome TaxID=652676 RepID=A0A3B0XFV5_9ZZZZ
MCRLITTLVVFLQLITFSVSAEKVTKEQIKGLDEQVQDIKKDVIDLTADLLQLEEKLLYPSNSQFALFVSLGGTSDKGEEGEEGLRLDSIQIKLENKVLMHHLYTFRELEAMRKGGVQKIYTGNIKTGEHQLVISYSAKAASGGDVKRSSSYTLKKGVGPKFVEIKIGGEDSGEQGIAFKDW